MQEQIVEFDPLKHLPKGNRIATLSKLLAPKSSNGEVCVNVAKPGIGPVYRNECQPTNRYSNLNLYTDTKTCPLNSIKWFNKVLKIEHPLVSNLRINMDRTQTILRLVSSKDPKAHVTVAAKFIDIRNSLHNRYSTNNIEASKLLNRFYLNPNDTLIESLILFKNEKRVYQGMLFTVRDNRPGRAKRYSGFIYGKTMEKHLANIKNHVTKEYTVI